MISEFAKMCVSVQCEIAGLSCPLSQGIREAFASSRVCPVTFGWAQFGDIWSIFPRAIHLTAILYPTRAALASLFP